MKNKKLWPLVLCLWLCLGVLTWAQVQVISSGGVVGAAGSGNGVTGYFADGTATAPSIAFASDVDGTGTGFYRSSANVIGVSNNGTNGWQWGATGNFIPVTNNATDLGGAANAIRDFFVVKSIQGGGTKTLTESAATGFVTVAIANSTGVSGAVEYTIRASDATDTQAVSGELFFSCVATAAGAVTCAALSDQHVLNPVSAGTLTNTMTNTTGANLVTLLANSVSSLTQTTLRIDYRVDLFGRTGAVTGL